MADMNDAQKTVNLLERIEFLLEAVAGELKVARIDRSQTPVGPMDRYNALKEAEASLNALEASVASRWNIPTPSRTISTV
jgi:hypothetical protein